MSDETEICEINECENPVQVVVTQEGTSKQRRVCHECANSVYYLRSVVSYLD